MHIDVHKLRIECEEDDSRMVAPLVEHGTAAVLDSPVDRQGFHGPAVDEDPLFRAGRTRHAAFGDTTVNADASAVIIQRDHGIGEIASVDVPDTRHEVFTGSAGNDLPVVEAQFESHVRMRQRDQRHDLCDVPLFGRVGPQELAPCRDIVEEIADRCFGSRSTADRHGFRRCAAVDGDLKSFL